MKRYKELGGTIITVGTDSHTSDRVGEHVEDVLKFNGMQYNLIRLEVKWAYVAVLNTLLNKPHYDQDNNAYVKDDSPAIIEMLVKIANKKVNAAKIEGYLDEMDELELVRRDGRNVYVRKIVSIF